MATEARSHLPPLGDVQDHGELASAASARSEGDLPLMNPSPLTLCFAPEIELTDELFWKLCAANRDLRLERTAEGDLEIMFPVGGESPRQKGLLTARLIVWDEGGGDDAGVCFDSSSGFKLPSGATTGPDASWITRDRWLALTPEQRQVFAPICPDFVAELGSPSDSKPKLREKMREFRDSSLISTSLPRPTRSHAPRGNAPRPLRGPPDWYTTRSVARGIPTQSVGTR